MLGNARPEKNKQYVHHVRRIISMMEEKMSKCETTKKLDKMIDKGGYTGMDDRVVQGDVAIHEDMGKEDPRAIYAEEMKSSSLLHHKVGICPSCEDDLICVSTKRAFGKPNMACECNNEKCGYKENR